MDITIKCNSLGRKTTDSLEKLMSQDKTKDQSKKPSSVTSRTATLVVHGPDGEVPLLDFLKSLPEGTKVEFPKVEERKVAEGQEQGRLESESEKPKSDFSELSQMFKRAVEKANELDVDEPPLVWPSLEESETSNSKNKKK